MVAVAPRSEWGARHENGDVATSGAPVILRLPFTEFWLHHSVTIAPDLVPPFDDEYRAMRALEQIGEDRFGRGISYTWPIMPNGRVYEGHGVDRRGAHTGGRNDIARAICLVGNYDLTPVSRAQIESAAQLMCQEYRAGRATRYTLNGGHRELKATNCPGKYGMEAIPAINVRAEQIMRGAPLEEDDLTPEQDRMLRDLHRAVGADRAAALPLPIHRSVLAVGWDVQAALTATLPVLLAEAQKPDADPAAVVAAVVAAIPEGIAQQVIDGLGRKLAPA